MKAMEWTTIDRATQNWPSGPWDGEPDKVQWQDEETGLPCIAVRHGTSGHWCGYVGVSEGHQHFRQSYEAPDVGVHGGLTYADFCEPLGDEHGKGICHLPEPGEPDRVWWFGFDCAHSGDYGPRDEMYARDRPELCFKRIGYDTYKTLAYVKQQCKSLARQLAAGVRADD